MATTLSAIVLRGRRWVSAHVGDSRIYLLRGGELKRLTQDHVWEHPELHSVLRVCRDLRVIVDLKVNDPAFGRLVVAELRKAGAVDRVCVGGVRRGVLRAIRHEEPALATSAAREDVRLALYRTWLRWPVTSPVYDGYQSPERAGLTRVVSPQFIADAHRAGLGVQVWTVNDEADARRLLGWGVDALITDRPDLMVPLVRGDATAVP